MSDRLEEILEKLAHESWIKGNNDEFLTIGGDFGAALETAKQALQSYIDTKITEELKKPNQLLRSMWQIAEREEFNAIFRKATTNWPGFKVGLKKELEREHKIMYPQALNHRKDK